MPSVMITVSGIDASTASSTADLVNAGGTKTTDTFASVALIASATVPYTGIERLFPATSKSTAVPAFRGFTPPTTFVPEASIRAVRSEERRVGKEGRRGGREVSVE